MTRILRTLTLVSVVALVATGCLRYEGDIAVDPQGQVTGTLSLAIEKSTAGFFGITSLEALEGSAQENEDNSFCAQDSVDYSQTATEYVISCDFADVTTTSSDDVSVTREGDEVVLRFRYNQDADAPTDPAQEYGSLRVSIAMPGVITDVTGQSQSGVERSSPTEVTITGKASSIYDLTITSSCVDGCSAPDVPTSAQEATRAFSGGRITEDTTFPARSRAYRIEKPIRIARGVEVIVDPGARFVWKGKDGQAMFVNAGDLTLEGSKRKPIVIRGISRKAAVDEKGNAAETSITRVRFRS